MIIVSFGIYGIRFRRARLFGDSEYPLLSIRFLLISLVIIKGYPAGLFREAILGLSEDSEWLIENARSVRFARRKAMAKVRAQMEAEYRMRIERAWEEASSESDKKSDLQNEVYALRRVIKGLQQEGSANG